LLAVVYVHFRLYCEGIENALKTAFFCFSSGERMVIKEQIGFLISPVINDGMLYKCRIADDIEVTAN
jgi:hypothetical protein